MAKIQDTITVQIADEYGRSLEAFIRYVIRDELRRVATEISTSAMKEHHSAVSEDDELVARAVSCVADAVQESAHKSEMEG